MIRPAINSEEALYCPRCQREAPRSEWLPIARRVRGGNEDGLPLLRIMKHRPCKELIHFPVRIDITK